jgi:hypothetical protein
MGDFAGFPRNLAYSVKNLSGFSKQTVKLTPDNYTDVAAGSTIRVKLPPNCLVDLRTLTAYFEGTITTSAGTAHFPRLSSSLIEQLTIYVNGTMIENIQNYNILYNTLYDLTCANDQTSKRFLENIDPSTSYNTTNLQVINNTQGAVVNDASKPMLINNWLGFIGSASTPVISTSDTNTIELEIRFAPATVLWQGGTASVTNANYKLSKIRFTISKIVFNDPTYYQLKASKLLSDGLLIGYKSYICNKSSTLNKDTSISYNINVNASSLDNIIATVQTTAPDTISPLLLTGSPHVTDGEMFPNAVATIASGTAEVLFNQSKYFQRDAGGIVGSQFEINNTAITPYALPIEEIYNETLIALGNLNIDVASGVHSGIVSKEHFAKYYFAHILSLENLDNSGQFFKSGLDGRASALNVVWKTSYSGTAAAHTPYLFCGVTKLMQINEGGQITVLS